MSPVSLEVATWVAEMGGNVYGCLSCAEISPMRIQWFIFGLGIGAAKCGVLIWFLATLQGCKPGV